MYDSTVFMSNQMLALLHDLTKRTGRKRIAQTVRDAIKAYNWLIKQLEEGKEIVAINPSERITSSPARKFRLLQFPKRKPPGNKEKQP